MLNNYLQTRTPQHHHGRRRRRHHHHHHHHHGLDNTRTISSSVGALCISVLLGCMLEFALEFICLPFLKHDISTAIWILEFYYLD
jgi:hypothetical protein